MSALPIWDCLRRAPAASTVSLTGFRNGFSTAFAILRSRFSNVVALFELTLFVSTDIAFVSPGVDQFPLRCFSSSLPCRRHDSSSSLSRPRRNLLRISRQNTVQLSRLFSLRRWIRCTLAPRRCFTVAPERFREAAATSAATEAGDHNSSSVPGTASLTSRLAMG